MKQESGLSTVVLSAELRKALQERGMTIKQAIELGLEYAPLNKKARNLMDENTELLKANAKLHKKLTELSESAQN